MKYSKLYFGLFTMILLILPSYSFGISISDLPYQPSEISLNGQAFTDFVAFEGFYQDCGVSQNFQFVIYTYGTNFYHVKANQYDSTKLHIFVPSGINYVLYRKRLTSGFCGSDDTIWTNAVLGSRIAVIPQSPLTTNILTSLPLINIYNEISFLPSYGLTATSPLLPANFSPIQYNIPTSVEIINPSRQDGYPYYKTDSYNKTFTFRTTPNDNYSLQIKKYPTQLDKYNNTNGIEVCSVQVNESINSNGNYNDIDCTLSHTAATNAYYKGLFTGNNQSMQFDFGTLYQSGSSIGDVLAPIESIENTRPPYNCQIWDIPCIITYIIKPYPSDFNSLTSIMPRFNEKFPFGTIALFADYYERLGDASTYTNQTYTLQFQGQTLISIPSSSFSSFGDVSLGLPFSFRDMMIFTYYTGAVFLGVRLITRDNIT